MLDGPDIYDEVTIIRNNAIDISDFENDFVVQEASADVPDQSDPEKYVNTDRYTLSRVVHTPLFYGDIRRFNSLKNFLY